MPHFRHGGPDHGTVRAAHRRTHRRSGPRCRQTSAPPAERGAEALEALEALEVLEVLAVLGAFEALDVDDGSTP
ncbi:hypothetical protein [Streptomyces spiralis]|uniref:hypothetical protein n=1 Tax=Streptomyces spiralis TaxID=66376 RepID=UPI0036D0E8A1